MTQIDEAAEAHGTDNPATILWRDAMRRQELFGICDGGSDKAGVINVQVHAEPCLAPHSDDESAKFEVKRSSASTCEYSMGRVGFEPT